MSANGSACEILCQQPSIPWYVCRNHAKFNLQRNFNHLVILSKPYFSYTLIFFLFSFVAFMVRLKIKNQTSTEFMVTHWQYQDEWNHSSLEEFLQPINSNASKWFRFLIESQFRFSLLVWFKKPRVHISNMQLIFIFPGLPRVSKML